jgi:hypothetical protein
MESMGPLLVALEFVEKSCNLPDLPRATPDNEFLCLVKLDLDPFPAAGVYRPDLQTRVCGLCLGRSKVATRKILRKRSTKYGKSGKCHILIGSSSAKMKLPGTKNAFLGGSNYS